FAERDTIVVVTNDQSLSLVGELVVSDAWVRVCIWRRRVEDIGYRYGCASPEIKRSAVSPDDMPLHLVTQWDGPCWAGEQGGNGHCENQQQVRPPQQGGDLWQGIAIHGLSPP